MPDPQKEELVRSDTRPLLGTGIVGQVFDKISMPHDALAGALVAKLKGRSWGDGITRGMAENIGIGDYLNVLEQEGIISRDTPMVGSGSPFRWLSTLFGDVGIDPITYDRVVMGLTQAGRMIRGIDATRKEVDDAARALAREGVISPSMLPDDPKLLARQKGLEHNLAQSKKLLSEKMDAFFKKHGTEAPTLEKRMGARVAAGQQKFFGLPPEAAGKTLTAVGDRARAARRAATATAAKVPLPGGKTVGDVAQATADVGTAVARKVFGKRLSETQQVLRQFDRLRRGEIDQGLTQEMRETMTQAEMAGKLSPQALEDISDRLKNIYELEDDAIVGVVPDRQPLPLETPDPMEELARQPDVKPDVLWKIQGGAWKPVGYAGAGAARGGKRIKFGVLPNKDPQTQTTFNDFVQNTPPPVPPRVDPNAPRPAPRNKMGSVSSPEGQMPVVVPRGTAVKLKELEGGPFLGPLDILDHILHKKGGTFVAQVADFSKIPGLKRGDTFIVEANSLSPRIAASFSHPAYRDLVNSMRSRFARKQEIEMRAGVLTKAVDGYFPTYMNPAATERIHKALQSLGVKKPAVARAYSTALGNNRAGKLQEMSIPAINEAIAADPTLKGALDEVLSDKSFIREVMELDPNLKEFLATGEKLFLNDPIWATHTRAAHSVRVLANTRFIERTIDHFAVPVDGKKALDLFDDRDKIREFLKNNTATHGLYIPTRVFQNQVGERMLGNPERLLRGKQSGLLDIEDLLEDASTDAVLEALKGRKAYVVPREVEDALQKMMPTVRDRHGLEPLVRGYDLIMDFWRTANLPYVAGYHSANGVANAQLLFFAGVGEGEGIFRRAASFATRMIEAAKLQMAIAADADPKLLGFLNAVAKTGLDRLGLRKYAPSLDELVHTAKDGRTFTGRQFADELAQWKVLNTGPSSDFTRTTMLPQLQFANFMKYANDIKLTPQEKLREAVAWFAKVGQSIGNIIDNHARIALWVDRRLKGASPWKSSEDVRKYLFYGDEINDVDRIMRRVMPFWLWTKFNTPLMLEMLIKHPEKVVKVLHAVRAFNSGMGPQEEAARMEHIRRQFGVTPRKNKDGTIDFLLMKRWVPLFDLNELAGMEEFLQGRMQALAPPLQAGLEIATGRDLLTGAPLNLDLNTGAEIPVVTAATGKRLPAEITPPRWILRILKRGIPTRAITDFAEAYFGTGKAKPEGERESYSVLEGAMRWLGPRPLTLTPDKAARITVAEATDKSDRMMSESRQLLRLGFRKEAMRLDARRLAMLREAKDRLARLRA